MDVEKELSKVLQKLSSIETKLDNALSDLADHETRLRSLESRGGKRWDALSEKIIMALVGGIVGWLLGQIIEIL